MNFIVLGLDLLPGCHIQQRENKFKLILDEIDELSRALFSLRRVMLSKLTQTGLMQSSNY